MKKNDKAPKSDHIIKEEIVDVKNTIVGFINPDRPDQTTEETINEYFKKKEEEIELETISEEEKKKKKKKLKEQQEELIKSIMARIPAIETKFEKMFTIETPKKSKSIKDEMSKQAPRSYNTIKESNEKESGLKTEKDNEEREV